MKKLGLLTIVAISACCFLLSLNPLKANATTAKLVFTGSTGPGDAYPYSFTVNGVPVSLMCVTDFEYIQNGESCTADVYTPSTAPTYPPSVPGEPVASSGLTRQDFLAVAWLFDNAVANPANELLDNEEAWYILDQNGQGEFGTQFSGNPAVTGPANKLLGETLTDPGNVLVYIWDGNPNDISGQYGSDDPQIFLGPTPEPSSLLLLGSGMLLFAGFLYRRSRNASGSLTLS
jgi:hypothetical protein